MEEMEMLDCLNGILRDENERLSTKVDSLQKSIDLMLKGLDVIECLYCEQILREDEVEHWRSCKNHPANAVIERQGNFIAETTKEIARLQARNDYLERKLRASAPDTKMNSDNLSGTYRGKHYGKYYWKADVDKNEKLCFECGLPVQDKNREFCNYCYSIMGGE